MRLENILIKVRRRQTPMCVKPVPQADTLTKAKPKLMLGSAKLAVPDDTQIRARGRLKRVCAKPVPKANTQTKVKLRLTQMSARHVPMEDTQTRGRRRLRVVSVRPAQEVVLVKQETLTHRWNLHAAGVKSQALML